MKITYCEKHNLPSYEKDNGEVVHTCTVCHPELIEPIVKTHKAVTNYGALFVNGKECSDFTLNHIVENGRIEFLVPEHAAVEFFNNCVDCGVDVEYGENIINGLKVMVYKSGAKDRTEKYWYSSSVVFPPNENLELPGLNVKNKGNNLVVSSNDFAGYVLSNVL
jgi:hypothetical protein